MKYIERYLERVLKIKPLGIITTERDVLNKELYGERIYIDAIDTCVFVAYADYLSWVENNCVLVSEGQNFTRKDVDDAYLKGVCDAKSELKKQGEQNHCMIQWKGDNLKEVIDFTGKDKNFEKWFKSFEEYEKYVQEHNGIFKLFNADGSHYEVLVGAWIVKTPDGYNVASKAIFRQKSVDTPKFKVGDWVVNKLGDSWRIDSFDKKNYQVSDGKGNYNYFPISKQDEMHLWTIQDAKDGDVLVDEDNNIGVYKKIEGIDWDSYIYLGCDGVLRGFSIGGKHEQTNTHPATKEQRDQLEKAIADADFTFDFKKKELKKIEEKAEWSEEDKNVIDITVCWLDTLCDYLKDSSSECITDVKNVINRLKSLKDRINWKPSDEQMEVLKEVVDEH